MHSRRLELSEAFLREAVYSSRERQAASVALKKTSSDKGNCGLGEKAAIVLDLSRRGEEIAHELWPRGIAGEALERVRSVTAQWVVEQDALDRKRNHFLKAFRTEHGFDRERYTPELEAEFEAGIARVNA